MKSLPYVMIAALFASTAAAEPTGDPASGEGLFASKCVNCHVVRADDDTVLAGRNARTGPNLFGVASGQTIGAVEGFRYGKPMLALNEQGVVWDEEKFVGYVSDPVAWLRETLDDPRARSKMALRLRNEDEARDIYAYLHSLEN